MHVTTDDLRQRLECTRQAVHAQCCVCGSTNGRVPRLRFTPMPQGGVTTAFRPGVADEGYAGLVHGGVIATLLDAAMTNCLFAQGWCGVTADLRLRYRHPVLAGNECEIRARIDRATDSRFVLSAELLQNGQRKATALGRFIVLPSGPDVAPRSALTPNDESRSEIIGGPK